MKWNDDMKSTGIIRKVDQLGRIVTPIELRRALDIAPGDSLEIFVENELIILRKYKADRACAITGEVTDKNTESTYVNGLYLSPEGAELLLQELQERDK